MLGLLVPITFAGVCVVLRQHRPDLEWRRAWLQATILTTTYMIAVTEGLSAVSAVTRPALVACWGIPAAALWAVVTRRWARSGLPTLGPRWPEAWPDRLILSAVGLIVVVTALVAWFAPPSTWDSLNYHLARVAHWAQNASLRHYATGIEIQNSRPPGAEAWILNLYVLGGGDRLANFVAWSAMVGSLIGASLVAGQLGGGTRAQLLAAGCAASIPMGIVQASSTMNDYVVAFWSICAAVEVIDLMKPERGRSTPWLAGAAAGLGVYTKPTAVAFLTPFAVLAGLGLVRHAGWKTAVRHGALALAVAVLVNVGPWMRNAATYGSIADPVDISRHANQRHDPRAWLSNLVRNLALHAGTPWPYVNQATGMAIHGLHRVMGIDPNDPRTTAAGDFGIRPPATQEDWVANPLHAVLTLIAFGLVFAGGKHSPSVGRSYAVAVVLGFVLFSILYMWLVFGSRLQLPAFVLAAPLWGVVLERCFRPKVAAGIALALVVLAWPWLLSVRSRPVVPMADSTVGSVLRESRLALYFANAPYLRDPLLSVGGMVREAGCSTVGIALSGSAPEYLLWVVTGAPRPDLRIEWIVGGTPSARYEDPAFAPCAVICDESCPADWTTIRGLPLVYERAGYRLFMAPSAVP